MPTIKSVENKLQSTATTLLRDVGGNLRKYYGILTVVE